MLPESALKNMYPLIVTPSHDGKYFHNYVLSLMNLVHYSASRQYPLQIFMQRGESLITRARNNCVAEFLRHPEWTHLFWIDSDIGFSPEAFHRLLLADRDITAGIYPLKRENWPEQGLAEGTTQAEFECLYTSYTVNTAPKEGENKIHLEVDEDGFLALNEAPTGFMCIKRSVFEKMIAAYPELQYVSDSDYSPDDGLHYRFFDCFVDPESRRYLSEDYAFCHLWRKLGGSVYVDAQSNLSHQGSKLYRGSFADTLKNNLPQAVCAPAGLPMTISFNSNLTANPTGPE